MMVLTLPVAAAAQNSATTTTPVADATRSVVHVLGLQDIKQNAKGKLAVTADGLDFRGVASHAVIRTAPVEDIFTGEDSRQTVGKGVTVAKIAVPYGGGGVLSLLSATLRQLRFRSERIEFGSRGKNDADSSKAGLKLHQCSPLTAEVKRGRPSHFNFVSVGLWVAL